VTLILSLANPDFALQIADRRITAQASGAIIEDYRPKMVLFGNQVVFSYTGMATLDGMNTDEWLGHTIFTSPNRDALSVFNHISKQAKEATVRETLRGGREIKHRRLAFVGVGFVRYLSDNRMRPIVVRISNFHTDTGTTTYPLPSYSVHLQTLNRRRRTVLMATPAQVSDESLRAHFRMIQKYSKKNKALRLAVALLCNLIRQVADRNKSVGKNLLVGFIPRKSAESDYPFMLNGSGQTGIFMSHKEGDDCAPPGSAINASFLDVPEKCNSVTLHGPIMVLPGVAALTTEAVQEQVASGGEEATFSWTFKVLEKGNHGTIGYRFYKSFLPGEITLDSLRAE
jgi:hypothetical protein